MVGTRGKRELTHSRLHHLLTGFVQPDIILHFARPHVGVRPESSIGKSGGLHLPCPLHTPLHQRRGLAVSPIGQLLIINPRHIKVDVNPVKQRTANPLLIAVLYTSPSPRDRTRSRMPSSA